MATLPRDVVRYRVFLHVDAARDRPTWSAPREPVHLI
jgi:hypothetical protein